MTDIEKAMSRLAATDCHCASCARTHAECAVREKFQRLPVSMGGLNECVTYCGGYVMSEDPAAVSELYYRYRGMVREQKDARRENRYDAYRLAMTLFTRSGDEITLWTIAGLLDYDPDQLRKDITALKQAAEDAL